MHVLDCGGKLEYLQRAYRHMGNMGWTPLIKASRPRRLLTCFWTFNARACMKYWLWTSISWATAILLSCRYLQLSFCRDTRLWKQQDWPLYPLVTLNMQYRCSRCFKAPVPLYVTVMPIFDKVFEALWEWEWAGHISGWRALLEALNN